MDLEVEGVDGAERLVVVGAKSDPPKALQILTLRWRFVI